MAEPFRHYRECAEITAKLRHAETLLESIRCNIEILRESGGDATGYLSFYDTQNALYRERWVRAARLFARLLFHAPLRSAEKN